MDTKKTASGDVIILIVKDLIDLFQRRFTITGWIRYIYERIQNKPIKFPYKRLPKEFYTLWVLLWLIFFIFIAVKEKPHYIFSIFILYRFWEIFIVNIWLFFIYRQLGRNTKDPSNVFRIFISLSWQYFTILIGYSVIYRTIYFYNPDLFINVTNDNFIVWLYFSMATLTTLGYSGIAPCQNSILAQITILSEVMMGILFIVLFVGATIANIDINFSKKKRRRHL